MSVNLYDLVIAQGNFIVKTNRFELDVKHADIRWTFWDDDISYRTDDNGFVLSVETLAVKNNNLIVVWENGLEDDFAALDYEDEDGNNLAEYIIDMVEAWAEDAFEDLEDDDDEDEDEDEYEEGVLPYEKHLLSNAYDNLKEYLTLEDLIEHMFNFFTSENLHDFTEHLLEELGLEVKDVM